MVSERRGSGVGKGPFGEDVLLDGVEVLEVLEGWSGCLDGMVFVRKRGDREFVNHTWGR